MKDASRKPEGVQLPLHFFNYKKNLELLNWGPFPGRERGSVCLIGLFWVQSRAKERMEREDCSRRRPGSVIPGGRQEKAEQAEACPDCS